MIAGIFHKGSGLGNQLHRYVATRVLALDNGYDFSMVAPENFKGSSFMSLDMGVKSDDPRDLSVIPYQTEMPSGKCIPISDMYLWEEKKVMEGDLDIRSYDPEFNFIKDNTIIDGEFQDIKYIEHHLDKILSWLNIKPELMSGFYDEICVIGFRGGEFGVIPDLFLTKEYWDEAIALIRKEKPDVVFKVVTDDPVLAKLFFPDFEVGNEIGDDWTSVLMAHYLIIANSSFYILPALLNQNAKKIIAPRYWARRNTKVWATPGNYYSKFTYL